MSLELRFLSVGMAFPPSFPDPESYLEECVVFFKEIQYSFYHQNTDVLVKNVLDNICIDNVKNINIFSKDFDVSQLVTADAYFKRFFGTLDKLRVVFERVEERDFTKDEDFEAPICPKKKHEVMNLVKEMGSLCEQNDCKLLVDFGSGLGYIDQLIFKVTKYNVLGLECNEKNYQCAQSRQNKYHGGSETNVRFLQHRVTKESHVQIQKHLQENFPDHGKFCIIGLHSCADLTVEAMFIFLKMADAKALALLPCCYHKMKHDGSKFKNFPLSQGVRAIFEKHDVLDIFGVPFLRLGAQFFRKDSDLYSMVFDLLVRAVLQLYAHNNGYDIKRNKRKAVRLKDKHDFEAYIIEAATNGYTLTPKSSSNVKPAPIDKNDEVINLFNIDEIRRMWWRISGESDTFKKAAIFILMQTHLQSIVENFVLLDRLLFFKENGIEQCYYKKIFDEHLSPRCMVLIAVK